MKSDLYIQSSNSLRLSALRDCRYALVVPHSISTPLLQFGEVEGEAQSDMQAGQGPLAGPRSAESTLPRAVASRCITHTRSSALKQAHTHTHTSYTSIPYMSDVYRDSRDSRDSRTGTLGGRSQRHNTTTRP